MASTASTASTVAGLKPVPDPADPKAPDVPGVALQTPLDYATHIYHHFVARVAERDGVQASLKQQGVATVIHYPIPLSEQPAFRETCRSGGPLPVTERLAREILSLPMFPEITETQIGYVVDRLRTALG